MFKLRCTLLIGIYFAVWQITIFAHYQNKLGYRSSSFSSNPFVFEKSNNKDLTINYFVTPADVRIEFSGTFNLINKTNYPIKLVKPTEGFIKWYFEDNLKAESDSFFLREIQPRDTLSYFIVGRSDESGNTPRFYNHKNVLLSQQIKLIRNKEKGITIPKLLKETHLFVENCNELDFRDDLSKWSYLQINESLTGIDASSKYINFKGFNGTSISFELVKKFNIYYNNELIFSKDSIVQYIDACTLSEVVAKKVEVKPMQLESVDDDLQIDLGSNFPNVINLCKIYGKTNWINLNRYALKVIGSYQNRTYPLDNPNVFYYQDALSIELSKPNDSSGYYFSALKDLQEEFRGSYIGHYTVELYDSMHVVFEQKFLDFTLNYLRTEEKFIMANLSKKNKIIPYQQSQYFNERLQNLINSDSSYSNFTTKELGSIVTGGKCHYSELIWRFIPEKYLEEGIEVLVEKIKSVKYKGEIIYERE